MSVPGARRPRILIGDVLAVPVNDSLVSFVQLVGNRSWPEAPEVKDAAKYNMFLAVFEGLNPIEEFSEWQPERPLLRAIFLSTPNWPHTHWTIVGHRDVPDWIPFPAFRSSTPAGEVLTDYTGRLRRRAMREEFRRLRSETSSTNGLLDELVLVVNGQAEDRLGLLKNYSLQSEDCLSAFFFPADS